MNECQSTENFVRVNSKRIEQFIIKEWKNVCSFYSTTTLFRGVKFP